MNRRNRRNQPLTTLEATQLVVSMIPSVMVDGEVNRSQADSNTNSDHGDDDEDDNDSEGAVADACFLDDQDFTFDSTTAAAAAHPSSLPQFVPLPNVLEESHNNNNNNNNGLPLLLGGHARIATTELDGHIRTKRPRLDDLAVDTAIGTSAATAASIHSPNDEAISTEAEAATEAEASENNNNNNNMSSSYTASSSSSVGAVDGGNSSLTVTSSSSSSSSSSHPSSSTSSSSSHSSNSSIAGSHRDGLARWQWRSRPSHSNKNRKNNKSANPKSSLLQQPSSGSFSSALTTATEDDDLIGIVEEKEEEEATIEGERSSFKGNPQPEQPLHDYDATSTCRESQPLLEQEQEKPQAMAFQPEEEHATTAGEAATPTKPICSDSGAVTGTGTTVTTMLELQITPQNSMAQFPCHYDHPPTPKASNVAPFRNNHSTFSFGDTRQQDAPPSSTITATTMAPLANTTTMIHLSHKKHHRKQNSNHRRHHHHHGNNHHNNSHSDAAAVEQLTSRLNNWCSINIKTKRRNNIYAEAGQQHNDNQDTVESNQEQQEQQQQLPPPPPPPLMASYPTAYRSNLYNPTQDYDYSNHWLARHIRKLQCQSANKEVMRALRNGNKKPPGVTATGGSTSSHSMGVTSSRNAVMDGSSTTALTPPSFLWIMKDPSNTNNNNDSTVGSTTGAAVDPPIFAAETTNTTSINNGSSTDVIMGE